MALTATATQQVINDIDKSLKLNSPSIVRGSFDRSNLFLRCIEIPKFVTNKKKNVTKQKLEHIAEIIKEYIIKYNNEKIIIYINSRDDCETIVKNINDWNFCCNVYHAGLTKDDRDIILNQFISGEVKIVIATTAFGMGIDQIVRCVMVFGCPKSIEEYYQQIGRCGRDNLQAETILFFDKQKYVMYCKIIEKDKLNVTNNLNMISKLKKIQDFVNIKTCRRRFIIEYFGLDKHENYFDNNSFFCTNCDNCTNNNLVDITNEIYDHKINSKQLTVDIQILDSIYNKWKEHIIKNDYTKDNLPENLSIKLPNVIKTKNEDIFDKYDNIAKSIENF
jgi:RecQ family ATP-dependent DNA helicase